MSEPELTGRTLADRYRIDQKLGQGGMATAWLAFDLRLARQVVVKIPLAEMLRDETAVQRFQLEIESLIRLRHPHVVHVLDAGVVDGRPYAVLDYLEGGSLDDRLAEAGGRLSPAEVLAWLPQIADALDHVHEEGMVHRDVKPGNILFDGKGHPALSDFGIVKALVSSPTGLTMTGQSPGSPRYMAPEVLGGHIGPAYDQYSLAAVAYRCLTGAAPEPLQTHVHLLADSAGRLPLPAISVLQMALSPAPGARFPDCSQFVSALGEALHGDVPVAPVVAGADPESQTRTYFVPTPRPGTAGSATVPVAAPTRRFPTALVVSILLAVAVGAGVWHFLLRDPGGSGTPVTVGRAAIRLAAGVPPTVTNRDAIEVRGILEGDGRPGLLLDGRHLRCDADGSFACVLTLEEGRNRFRLAAEDGTGNVVDEKILEVVRHSVLPEVRLDPVPRVTNARRLEISGTVVTEYPGEARVAGRSVDLLSDGGFRTTVTLAEGPNRITVEAVDGAGNRSPPAAVDVIVDVESPVVRITGGPEQYSASLDFEVRGRIEDAHPGPVTISGLDCEPDGQGQFAMRVRLEGERTSIVVGGRDRAGNKAPPQRLTVILDEVAPTIEAEIPEGGTLTSRPACEIRVRVTDAAPAEVRIGDRDAEPAGDGTWRATLTLVEGENRIEIVARDRAGNEARAEAERTLDTRPPTLRIEPAEGIGSRLWIRGRVTDERPSHVLLDGRRVELAADGAFESLVELARPGTTVRVEAVDLAGNRSTAREVAAATSARGPEIVLDPSPERTKADTVEIKGTVDQDGVQVLVNDRPAEVRDRTFSVTVELAPGVNTIVVIARDRRGAESRREVRIHRDAVETPPPERVLRGIRQLGSADPGERFFAATDLGRAGHAAGAEPLEIVLRSDSDDAVRRAAARSLGQIGAWRSVPALIDALAAAESLVASDAKDALRGITGRDFGWRPGLVGEQLAEVQRTARAWWENHPDGTGE